MSEDNVGMSKKERRKAEKEMFRKVLDENYRELDGTATRERVETALHYIMEPGMTFNTEIAVILTAMLGNEPKYDSKWEMWQEAMDRLYPVEPESESEASTIEVDLEESEETIVVDLESLD